MKKMTYLGLALAATAALTLVSCEKQNGMKEETPERRPVSFEVSIPGADTKMLLMEGATSVKASWVVGDEVAVIWGTPATADTYEKFTVSEVKNGGKTAVFTNEESALPAAGETKVGVYYPYIPFDGDSWTANFLFDAGGGNLPPYKMTASERSDLSVSAAGKYVMYGAWNVSVTDGAFEDFSLQQLNSLVKIPSGTSTDWSDDSYPDVGIGQMYYQAWGFSTSYQIYSTKNKVGAVSVLNRTRDFNDTSTKKLTHDIYIPVLPGEYTDLILTLGHRSIELGNKTIEAGKIYDLSAKVAE